VVVKSEISVGWVSTEMARTGPYIEGLSVVGLKKDAAVGSRAKVGTGENVVVRSPQGATASRI
jgi:hypothetical protein